jgi:hypothetical protein
VRSPHLGVEVQRVERTERGQALVEFLCPRTGLRFTRPAFTQIEPGPTQIEEDPFCRIDYSRGNERHS